MNDYDKISDFELNSYKSIGSLNEDNLVATSDLSDAVSAICYNLSNMLDKRDENSRVSGNVEISGFLSVGENIAHGTSLTSGIGVGDSNGNPVEVEMSAVHGAAFNSSKALGLSSFAANKGNAYAKYSAAFNDGTAYSSYSLAHGTKTSAFGYVSHVEGEYTQTGLPDEIGNSSSKQTYGAFSHAEGDHTKAIGLASHAEGQSTYALSSCSHAEGSQTSAFGSSSHSEGYKTTTIGDCSHAEGDQTYAGGQKSHAEGGEVSALGFASHAEGRSTIARARYSHAEGACTESLCAEGLGDEYSYVWSGVYNTSGNRYPSHGAGSFSINPKEGINGFFIVDKSFNDYLSGLSGDLNPQIERKLDKYDGGIVSGNVAVFQHDMKILSGNYIQTNDDSLSVQNFSYKNAFLQAECPDSKWGIACTGAKGYCILSVNSPERKIKLSGDISLLESNKSEKYSWSFGSGGDCQSFEISTVNVDDHIITLKNAIPNDLYKEISGLTSEEEYKHLFETDDNAFYCPAKPDIGNTVIHNFYANHAEGGSVKAIGKYTHAEGRATIADMRYSHAEGDRTVAGRMAAHAEGQGTKAYGHYSHVEGYYTTTDNDAKAAHAEGLNTITNGEGSHAEGLSSSTFSTAAHAEGYKTIAGARGYKCIDAKGTIVSNKLTLDTLPLNWKANDTVTIINNAIAYNDCATISSIFPEGSNYKIQFNSNLPFSKIDNASNTFIINKICMDNGNIDVGPYAHAEGNGSIATGNSAHAEGTNTKALNNQCHAEGGTTTASGKQAHAEGLLTLASGNQSHAEGLYTIASNAGAHAAGISAVAKDKYSYVWNGIDAEQLSSNGPGTFNIYPKDSAKGFYIGDQNLCSIISNEIDSVESHSDSAVNQLKSQISSALSTIAADPLSSLTYSSDIDKVISAAVEMRNILSSLYDAMKS